MKLVRKVRFFWQAYQNSFSFPRVEHVVVGGALQIILAGLKLGGVISASWLWILLPLLGTALFFIAIFCIAAIMGRLFEATGSID